MRSTALLALAAAHLAKAQTFSDCDPTDGDECDPDPAFGQCQSEIDFDFTSLPHGDDGWKDDSKFKGFFGTGKDIDSQLSVDDDGLAFTIENEKQSGPLIKTNQYLFFGRVEVQVKAAPGVGVVTSVVLESKDRDEIDWEWLGGDPANVQTNFFSRGVNDLANGETHGIAFNAAEGTHTYTIDWTPEAITFYIDGAKVRDAPVGDPGKWPQTPMQVKLGTWVGGHPDNEEGTIEWAGGLTDFGEAPFVAWYKHLKIVDYCGGKDAAEEYKWKDGSGTQDSIEVVGAKGDGGFSADGSKGDVEGEDNDKDEDKDKTKTGASKPTKGGDSSKTDADGAEKTDDPDAAEGSEEGDDDSAASVAGLSSTLVAMIGLGYLVVA